MSKLAFKKYIKINVILVIALHSFASFSATTHDKTMECSDSLIRTSKHSNLVKITELPENISVSATLSSERKKALIHILETMESTFGPLPLDVKVTVSPGNNTRPMYNPIEKEVHIGEALKNGSGKLVSTQLWAAALTHELVHVYLIDLVEQRHPEFSLEQIELLELQNKFSQSQKLSPKSKFDRYSYLLKKYMIYDGYQEFLADLVPSVLFGQPNLIYQSLSVENLIPDSEIDPNIYRKVADLPFDWNEFHQLAEAMTRYSNQPLAPDKYDLFGFSRISGWKTFKKYGQAMGAKEFSSHAMQVVIASIESEVANFKTFDWDDYERLNFNLVKKLNGQFCESTKTCAEAITSSHAELDSKEPGFEEVLRAFTAHSSFADYSDLSILNTNEIRDVWDRIPPRNTMSDQAVAEMVNQQVPVYRDLGGFVIIDSGGPHSLAAADALAKAGWRPIIKMGAHPENDYYDLPVRIQIVGAMKHYARSILENIEKLPDDAPIAFIMDTHRSSPASLQSSAVTSQAYPDNSFPSAQYIKDHYNGNVIWVTEGKASVVKHQNSARIEASNGHVIIPPITQLFQKYLASGVKLYSQGADPYLEGFIKQQWIQLRE